MVLRLSLVIEGDATGAKKALEETAGAVDKLDKSTESVAENTGAAADAMDDVGEASKGAAGGIDAAGGAAEIASGRFSSLKGAAIGLAAGLVGGIALGALTAGITAAGGAAVRLFREITSNTPRIERDLKSHADLVDAIKGAYDRARGAASDYGLESRALLTFQAQQNVGRLAADFTAAVSSIEGRGTFNAIVGVPDAARFGPFLDVMRKFRADIRDGRADVIAFREAFAGIATALPADSRFRVFADAVLEDTEQAALLQAELTRAIDLFRGLAGNAAAAATAIGGSAEKMQLAGEAAAGAITFLADYDALMASISGRPPLAKGDRLLLPGEGRPLGPGHFAAGGVVMSPTLFGYGAGQLGLMGEAGPEAIMPLRSGRVGARAGGREIGLSLTRLASGALGVALPTPFARGGVVTQFATGGVVAAGGGFGGLDLANEISALSGAVVDFGKRLVKTGDVLDAFSGAALSLSQRLLDAALNAVGSAVEKGLTALIGNALGGIGGGGAPFDIRPAIAQGNAAPSAITNVFNIETPTPRAFAESRAVVARAGARLMARTPRVT